MASAHWLSPDADRRITRERLRREQRQVSQPARVGRRVLGSGENQLETSAQGFGCMGITAFYGSRLPDEDAIALMTHAYHAGITHFDTAEVYTCVEGGETIYNEAVVGEAVRAMAPRDEIQLATKYFPAAHGDQMSPEVVLEALRASCSRLGVEYVDLYYVHRIHPTVPVEEQAAAMKACVDSGMAIHIGLSEFSADNIRRFHAVCPVTAIQQEWSLINRDLEAELVPTCRQLGIGIVAYSPLCRSLLSGEVSVKEGDMKATRYGRFTPENIETNRKLVQPFVYFAQSRGVTAAQLSLAWVQCQGEDVVPIPGTTKISHLESNIEAATMVLSPEEMQVVESAVPKEQILGDRFTGGSTANTFRDQGIN